jgi:hypothetical protein
MDASPPRPTWRARLTDALGGTFRITERVAGSAAGWLTGTALKEGVYGGTRGSPVLNEDRAQHRLQLPALLA